MDYAELFNRNRVEWLYKLARDGRLGPTAVRVGLLFGTFFQAEEREEVRPTYQWIMDAAHIKGRSTLAGALRELEACGYLVITKYHRERSIYGLPFDGENHWVQKLDT